MSREEQRKFRLVEQELKKAIREACKRHKYKIVDGRGYIVVNGGFFMESPLFYNSKEIDMFK